MTGIGIKGLTDGIHFLPDLKIGVFAPLGVLPQLPSMVAEEHNYRVIRQAQIIQLCQN